MKREIEFVKFNPTQNMTILVRTSHPLEEQPFIAARMMSYDHVHAEQVGFIERPRRLQSAAHLQMAGGEFCGNACMSLAAYLASERGMIPNETTEFVLETSGIDHFIVCQVKKVKEGYLCQITMPVPQKIEQKIVDYEGEELKFVVVKYPGFFHLVVEVEDISTAMKKKAQGLAKLLGATLEANIIGILLFKSDSNELAPLIYVLPLESMVWERGCSSGTASLGAYLAWKNNGDISVAIAQPGGTIHVTATFGDNMVTHLSIEGSVGIVADGRAFIELESEWGK